VSEESPEITYEKWYPDIPPVMDSQELADLLSASDQLIRTWAREGVIPAHRAPSAAASLSHQIASIAQIIYTLASGPPYRSATPLSRRGISVNAASDLPDGICRWFPEHCVD